MRILFITQGLLVDQDQERVAEVVARYARDVDVDELYFSFTEETTPGAAYALGCAVQLRSAPGPSVTSIVPHRLTELPAEARHAAALGDDVFELALGEGRYGYNRYTSRVVEVVRGCGQVVVFWDGSYIREPWDILRWLHVLGGCQGEPWAPFDCVLAPLDFEFYKLRGPTSLVREAPSIPEKKRKGAK